MATRARRTYTDAEKAEALALYELEGPTAVQAKLGISKGTVASWAHRAGLTTVCSNPRTVAAVEAAQLSWANRRAGMVDTIGDVADLALARCHEALIGGFTSKAKDCATTMAILVDKAQLLGGDATARQESRQLRDALLEQARENAQHLRSVA